MFCSEKPANFVPSRIQVDQWISAGNLPLELQESQEKEQKTEAIIASFINVGRLSDFGSLMRVKLIQKLVPNLSKEGYEETQDQTAEGSSRQPAPGREPQPPRYDPPGLRDPLAQPHPLQDPLVQPPRRGGRPLPDPMPGFDDEHEIYGRPGMGGQPGGRLGRYGERDLYPQGLGPNDPLRGGVGPGFGGMGGGGMHPTFDDPLFTGQGQQGGRGGQAPPGARYDDPFGPGGAQGGHPRGAGMGGRPPNPFGGFGDGDFI